MSSARSFLLPAAAMLVALPTLVHAQESDALPFQAGRWAIEVSSQQELGSLGFLRFTSPGSAWLIAPGIIVGTGEATDGVEEVDISTLGVDLRLGYRRYRALGRGVASHLGLGVLGQLQRTEFEQGGTTSEEEASSFGVYGELGGSYYVTPRFGLGGTAVASLTRDHSETGEFGFEFDTWTFALPAARFHVTIVF